MIIVKGSSFIWYIYIYNGFDDLIYFSLSVAGEQGDKCLQRKRKLILHTSIVHLFLFPWSQQPNQENKTKKGPNTKTSLQIALTDIENATGIHLLTTPQSITVF